jgi:hypothetical protein
MIGCVIYLIITIEPKITKEFLLSKNSEETYMAHYLGIPVKKGLFRSPVFDGVATITDNYLGNKLFFSDYEEGKRAEYLKSKPTDMATAPAQVDSLMATDDIGDLPAEYDELDLNNLL